MNPISHYEFWSLVGLANIELTSFGVCGHLVSSVQLRGIQENYESTATSTISA